MNASLLIKKSKSIKVRTMLALLAGIGVPIVASATSLKGDGFTSSSDITGHKTTGVLSFVFDVTGEPDGSAKGMHAESRLSQSAKSQGELDLISSGISKVECLVIDGHTAWWSGTATFGTPDPRVNDASNQQGARDIAQRNMVQFGKFVDEPGKPEQRSLFASAPLRGQLPLNDPGEIGTSIFAALGSSGADVCKLKDVMFDSNADYRQVDSDPIKQTATIVWLRADGKGDVPGLVQLNMRNLVKEMGNPPKEARYSARGFPLRTFTAGRVKVGQETFGHGKNDD
jgi:hypothetical protein